MYVVDTAVVKPDLESKRTHDDPSTDPAIAHAEGHRAGSVVCPVLVNEYAVATIGYGILNCSHSPAYAVLPMVVDVEETYAPLLYNP